MYGESRQTCFKLVLFSLLTPCLPGAASPVAEPPDPPSLVKMVADQINQFMLEKAERTRDGGLSHFNGKPQLWVDTLDMCCPVLSHSARIMDRPQR